MKAILLMLVICVTFIIGMFVLTVVLGDFNGFNSVSR